MMVRGLQLFIPISPFEARVIRPGVTLICSRAAFFDLS